MPVSPESVAKILASEPSLTSRHVASGGALWHNECWVDARTSP